MSDTGHEPVTRAEFTTLQKEVTATFSLLRDEMREHQNQMSSTLERIGAEQKETMERIYKTTRPQVSLWIMIAAVALSVISLVGGLIGYGLQRENGHLADSVEHNSQWVDYYIKRDLDELQERKSDERRAAQRKLDQ